MSKLYIEYKKEFVRYVKEKYNNLNVIKTFDSSRDNDIRRHMYTFLLTYCKKNNNSNDIKKIIETNKEYYNKFMGEMRK